VLIAYTLLNPQIKAKYPEAGEASLILRPFIKRMY